MVCFSLSVKLSILLCALQFLWSDSNDNLHILYHAFDEGGHCFAPKDDPTNWTTQPYPAYNRTVHWINGTSRIVPRRERPQLFLSGSTPQVIIILVYEWVNWHRR